MKSEDQEKNKCYVGPRVTVSKVVNMTPMSENISVIGILRRHTVPLWEWDNINLGVLRNLFRIETTETGTETSLGTIRNKTFVSVVSL
jgi:hypothetical protein